MVADVCVFQARGAFSYNKLKITTIVTQVTLWDCFLSSANPSVCLLLLLSFKYAFNILCRKEVMYIEKVICLLSVVLFVWNTLPSLYYSTHISRFRWYLFLFWFLSLNCMSLCFLWPFLLYRLIIYCNCLFGCHLYYTTVRQGHILVAFVFPLPSTEPGTW